MSFVSDVFTDTDGTNLESHTGGVGATWTVHPTVTASAKIQTNRVYSNGAGRLYYASGVPGSADYEVEAVVRVVSRSSSGGIVGRLDASADTRYTLRLTGATTDFQLLKHVAGALTVLGSYTVGTPANGTDFTLWLEMVGSTIKGYLDGVERISVTDSDITVAGRAGVVQGGNTTGTGYHVADITATDIGSAPAVPCRTLLGVGT